MADEDEGPKTIWGSDLASERDHQKKMLGGEERGKNPSLFPRTEGVIKSRDSHYDLMGHRILRNWEEEVAVLRRREGGRGKKKKKKKNDRRRRSGKGRDIRVPEEKGREQLILTHNAEKFISKKGHIPKKKRKGKSSAGERLCAGPINASSHSLRSV